MTNAVHNCTQSSCQFIRIKRVQLYNLSVAFCEHRKVTHTHTIYTENQTSDEMLFVFKLSDVAEVPQLKIATQSKINRKRNRNTRSRREKRRFENQTQWTWKWSGEAISQENMENFSLIPYAAAFEFVVCYAKLHRFRWCIRRKQNTSNEMAFSMRRLR